MEKYTICVCNNPVDIANFENALTPIVPTPVMWNFDAIYYEVPVTPETTAFVIEIDQMGDQ